MLQGLAVGDRVRELKIADALLTPHFEACFTPSNADYESLTPRVQALASGLATVIKVPFYRWKQLVFFVYLFSRLVPTPLHPHDGALK